jgi:hypothetical protein
VLPVAAIGSVALTLVMIRVQIGGPPDPTPPPPTIFAPRGELPAGPVGLQEWARYRGEAYSRVRSGFLILLNDGTIVGVTTAHSVLIGDPDHPLEQIALAVAGQSDFVAEFDTLWGQPGQPRTGGDMTVDYVLLQADQPIDSSFVLAPDPRGAPQPGERVSLFSGLGDGHGGRRILEGTVQSVDDMAVWVLMDDLFNPAGPDERVAACQPARRPGGGDGDRDQSTGQSVATGRASNRVYRAVSRAGSRVPRNQRVSAVIESS